MIGEGMDGGLEMAEESEGGYVSIVVSVQPQADGSWRVRIEGPGGRTAVPLKALTFVARLWSSHGVMRGVIQLTGESEWVPVQLGAQIEQQIRRWLDGTATQMEP